MQYKIDIAVKTVEALHAMMLLEEFKNRSIGAILDEVVSRYPIGGTFEGQAPSGLPPVVINVEASDEAKECVQEMMPVVKEHIRRQIKMKPKKQ